MTTRYLADMNWTVALPFIWSALLPAALAGQQRPNALLWSISGPDLHTRSFLYGTVHTRDHRAFTYADAVEAQMTEVSTVAGELDLDASRNAGLQLMGSMMLPDGERLQDLYKKKDWPEVEAYLAEKLGVMAAMLTRMKPFFILATLTEMSMPQDRSKVLDDHLLSHARDQGKRVIGLETLDEQVGALDALSLKEQAAMLLDYVRSDDHQGTMEEMMRSYVRQDLNALMELTKDTSLPKTLESSLLTERNSRMAHRMDSVMRVDSGALFLVGAAHLSGDHGLIPLLEKRGYSVLPMALNVPPMPGIREEEPGE